MDLSKFEIGIEKSGFVLENRIANLLEKAGWSVLSNRYYIDDAQETVREIDLVAFQTSKQANFTIYTSLIISCKKSERPWGLLSREINLKKPNADWWPLHVWTNDRAVEYVLKQQGAPKKFHVDARKLEIGDALRMPEVDVFAFQEMDPKTGDPKNDTKIFETITALMKAQSYEMNALPSRKKEPAIYQFNLLSVLDGELVRLKFSGEEAKAEAVESEHYLAEYIVRKQRTVSRIHFVKANHFEKCLTDYKRLHDANAKLFSLRYDDFYRDVLQDAGRIEVFIDQFRKGVCGPMSWRLKYELKENFDLSDLSIGWHPTRSMARITAFALTERAISFLNSDKSSGAMVRAFLKKLYRYEAEFCFDSDDIPF